MKQEELEVIEDEESGLPDDAAADPAEPEQDEEVIEEGEDEDESK